MILEMIPSIPEIRLNREPKTFRDKFANLKHLFTQMEKFAIKTLMNYDLTAEEIDFVEIANNSRVD